MPLFREWAVKNERLGGAAEITFFMTTNGCWHVACLLFPSCRIGDLPASICRGMLAKVAMTSNEM